MARALDILQAENNVYMGWLLPTLYELLVRLGRLSLTYCTPLVPAAKSGIMECFGHMLQDAELISAALLLPKFKTIWTKDNDVIQKGRRGCFSFGLVHCTRSDYELSVVLKF